MAMILMPWKLPAEAMKAQPFYMGLMASEAAPSVQEGNETMLNETLQNETMPVK